MAIVIQQEKNNVNWLFIFSLLFILGVIGVAAFYLFFVDPEKIDKRIISAQFKTISDLEALNFNPDDLLQDSNFTKLQPTIKLNIPPSAAMGKSNPFLP